jgi:hypothetical protein
MPRNSVTNAFGLILAISTFLFFGSLAFVFLRARNYNQKYEKTRLNISEAELKDNWGKPDDVIYHDSITILLYHDRIMTDYVFKFDKKSKKLVEKWSGD